MSLYREEQATAQNRDTVRRLPIRTCNQSRPVFTLQPLLLMFEASVLSSHQAFIVVAISVASDANVTELVVLFGYEL